jgi:formamidopyrimidine-DNA glycosylase
MPELPDVAGFKAYFEAHAIGRRIESTAVRDERILDECTPQQLGRVAKGARFTGASWHGKFLFLSLSGSEEWVYLHFGMTGLLQVFEQSETEPDYARVLWLFSDGGALAYISRRMLGRVGITEDRKQFLKDESVGPDALDENLDLKGFRELTENRKGALKSFLMNQEIIAGIGNVYADEILFQSHLYPGIPVNDLTPDIIKRLFRIMRRVLQTAVRHNGDVSELPRRYLLPRREAGAACPACDAQLAEMKISGRTTIYCPRCQKETKT